MHNNGLATKRSGVGGYHVVQLYDSICLRPHVILDWMTDHNAGVDLEYNVKCDIDEKIRLECPISSPFASHSRVCCKEEVQQSVLRPEVDAIICKRTNMEAICQLARIATGFVISHTPSHTLTWLQHYVWDVDKFVGGGVASCPHCQFNSDIGPRQELTCHASSDLECTLLDHIQRRQNSDVGLMGDGCDKMGRGSNYWIKCTHGTGDRGEMNQKCPWLLVGELHARALILPFKGAIRLLRPEILEKGTIHWLIICDRRTSLPKNVGAFLHMFCRNGQCFSSYAVTTGHDRVVERYVLASHDFHVVWHEVPKAEVQLSKIADLSKVGIKPFWDEHLGANLKHIAQRSNNVR